MSLQLIINGGFDTDLSGWTLGGVGGGTITHDGSIVYAGSGSLRLEMIAAVGDRTIEQEITIPASATAADFVAQTRIGLSGSGLLWLQVVKPGDIVETVYEFSATAGTSFHVFTADLMAYAGMTVKIRLRAATTDSASFVQAWFDEIAVNVANLPVLHEDTFTIVITGTYALQLVADNNPTTWSTFGLPFSASLDTATGVVTITPDTLGSFSGFVFVLNSDGIDSGSISFEVIAAPVITTTPPGSGEVGNLYAYTLQATGAERYGGRSLPPWLGIDPFSGQLSGTPDAPGSYSFQLFAAAGTTETVQDVTLIITGVSTSSSDAVTCKGDDAPAPLQAQPKPLDAPFVFPASDLDSPDPLMNALGSFWENTYEGNDLVRAYAAARLSIERQTRLDLLELVAAVSRLDIPVFHVDNWSLITLRESERNDTEFSLAKFDEGYVFDSDNELRFDVPRQRLLNAWKAPPELADAPALMNRISSPSVTLTRGVDFILQSGHLVFRDNPFDNPLAAKRTILQNNTPIDREASFWIFRGDYDRQTLHRQFGYVLSVKRNSSTEYKTLLNALFDAIVLGTTANNVQTVWAAITGVPLVQEATETVELVRDEGDRKLVVTDRHVYAYASAANVTVAAGDVVHCGDPLTDALIFYEFNRGQSPTFEQLRALVLGQGLLLAGFFGDLTFQNKDVPLVVSQDDDGFTRVSFDISGWPGDVTVFFDEMHARGRASGSTLANLLDQRPAAARDTEPTAGSLPATINPLKFLCQNILRDNAFAVKVRTAACVNGLGLDAAKFMRKIVPPQTVMIVIAELEYADDPIKMEGPGTETDPGFEEEGSIFLGNLKTETLGPELVTENLRLFQVGGRCM